MTGKKLFVSGCLLLSIAAGPARADVVLDWNNVLLDAIRVDKTAPPRASRAMAIVQVAVYDAVAGVLPGQEPYYVVTIDPPAGASAEAAAVEAAYQTLTALFPVQASTFAAERTASLAAIPDGPAEQDGIAWGKQVAEEILTLRHDDHSNDIVPYEPPTGGGWWAPTLPALAPPLLPNWPTVTPWTLTSRDQFRQGPPPPPNSPEYTEAFREVRRLGRKNSPNRTAEQTAIALFWADGPGTATPPGHWMVIAQDLALQKGTSMLENARMLALLGIAMADAAIVSWDHKYYYSVWRPITGIRNADQDGNPETVADPNWEPLIPTPPFPSYTSGHSTFSGAAARILALFFGTDQISFSTTAEDGPVGVTRSFESFSQAAEEAGKSRVYGGIHWEFDNQAGLASGRELADHVFFSFLRPAVVAGTCVPGPTTLCLEDGRFKVEARWATENASGAGQAVEMTDDSGRFWFFDAENPEIVVKVIDACDSFDHFWVFASGLTNVEVQLTVTDTQEGRARQYYNAQGRPFAPIQDTDAFATCH
ncbi:MAG TPA: phosphatase PAP2 family protein [Thermoanaerobaculia bacterium]|nr:phosphatase PAP2 family protein [Thermoanaerobaculia bacterium]